MPGPAPGPRFPQESGTEPLLSLLVRTPSRDSRALQIPARGAPPPQHLQICLEARVGWAPFTEARGSTTYLDGEVLQVVDVLQPLRREVLDAVGAPQPRQEAAVSRTEPA